MLRQERNYDFRKRLLSVHKADIRDENVVSGENDFVISDGVTILLPQEASQVILTAAEDFVEYLFVSMGVAAMRKKGNFENMTQQTGRVILHLPQASEKLLGEANGYMGYSIEIADNIEIYAHDDRGVAQALYHLEDLMSTRRAPFLEKGVIRRKSAFSPRMVHSGYGLDQFPDQHLAAIAHAGMDAILIFTKAANLTPVGYVDFNELIYRASRYGIDVYAYSYLESQVHPENVEAEVYYDKVYGQLFKECPDLKGIVMVGESVEFPSKDPKVTKPGFVEEDAIPSEKPRPGWWPCQDYGQWLRIVQKSIQKYSEKADIVFWSYNWGWAPKEDRLALLEQIPNGISLLVTYEMFEVFQVGSAKNIVSDYTLSFAGPGAYFVSEAQKAKELGIRLYAMANAAGLTWDFGVVPYEPMPFQWLKRYQGLLEAKEKWGLCGIMESHHFGFWPSFINAFEKEVFFASGESGEALLDGVLQRYFGRENAAKVREALYGWSKAITYYLPTNEDQYGAFRIGPAYPLCLNRRIKPPSMEHAMFGNGIFFEEYPMDYGNMVSHLEDKCTLIGMKLDDEIHSLKTMRRLLEEGVAILDSIENKNDELFYLLNLGRFLVCTTTTGIHAKQWYRLKNCLKVESKPDVARQLLEDMEELAKREIENTKSAIPLVQADSRLGWEPSMEYIADEKRLLWKIRQVEFMMRIELGDYKKRLNLSLEEK